MINIDQLAEKIFGIMKGFGHQIKLFTDEGTETVNPADARRFFSSESGLMVTIDEDGNEVQLSKSNDEPLDATKKLQQNMKKLANEFLMNYTVRSYGKSIQPRDFSFKAKIKRNAMAESSVEEGEIGDKIKKALQDVDYQHKPKKSKGKKAANQAKGQKMKNVAEGISKLTGSKKTSHQTLENVRILVKHKTAVDEEVRGSRSRNIHSVFLEQNGERFRFPHNHLGGARAMARHMSMGGNMQDKVGGYIIESVSSLLQLSEFLRYAKSNRLVNEDTNDIIETVRDNVIGVKHELNRLAGIKTYESIKSRIEEQEEFTLQESDIDSLRDMFTVKKFDEKFDGVLPVVNRLVQEKDQFLRRIEESSGSSVYVSPRTFSIDSILEFANEQARFGHNLSEISSRILENTELASYVNSAGRKLSRGGELSVFERNVVSSVLENLCPQVITESPAEIQESQQYEQFYDKYTYLFV